MSVSQLFDCVPQFCPLVIFLGYVLITYCFHSPKWEIPGTHFFNKQLTEYICVEFVLIGLVKLFIIHKTKLVEGN
jgi:hypothetical protein